MTSHNCPKYDLRPVRKEMLRGVMEVQTEQNGLSFSDAKELARSKAKTATPDPMLLAWFHRTPWMHAPDVT